jgi:hypothetical protein
VGVGDDRKREAERPLRRVIGARPERRRDADADAEKPTLDETP